MRIDIGGQKGDLNQAALSKPQPSSEEAAAAAPEKVVPVLGSISGPAIDRAGQLGGADTESPLTTSRVSLDRGGSVADLKMVPHSDKSYRLRSDNFCSHLHRFAERMNAELPEGYAVIVSISPFGGGASVDMFSLVKQTAEGKPQEGMCKIRCAFDAENFVAGWAGMVGADRLCNSITSLKEQLFFALLGQSFLRAAEGHIN